MDIHKSGALAWVCGFWVSPACMAVVCGKNVEKDGDRRTNLDTANCRLPKARARDMSLKFLFRVVAQLNMRLYRQCRRKGQEACLCLSALCRRQCTHTYSVQLKLNVTTSVEAATAFPLPPIQNMHTRILALSIHTTTCRSEPVREYLHTSTVEGWTTET